ncbi:hypothetical protein U0070_009366 [Myodes glareolus]|uniref:IRG-type G domain-containing protein n=1 Tax=Myodes glareolus TaxID=447135 RepID=A0AAW0I7I4_MYOGA
MSQLLSDASKDEDMCKYYKMIKEENRTISQKTITSIELHQVQGNIQKTNNVIIDSLRETRSTSLNIAVIGESGTGKSSFINAFRGIGHEEENSAPIGVVETTMRRTPYKHPNIPNVVIWDLPGIGTTKFPPKDYLEKMKFSEYDFFIIVSATRFKKNDIDLAKAVSMMKKDFYFVRTKVDIDLETEKGCKHAFGRENLLQQIQRHCDKLKNKLSIPTLQNFMSSSLSKAEAGIERKRELMQQFIWLETIKKEAWASLSIKGILKDSDMEQLKVILNHYRKLFGVDDGTLKLMAKDSQVPVEKLKKVIKSVYLLETKERETLEGKLLKYLEKFASVNGGLLTTGFYFRKTVYLQLLFLDTVAEDAKVVLRETYSKISSNSHHPQLLTVDKCYSFLISLTGFVFVFFVLFHLRLWAWNEV